MTCASYDHGCDRCRGERGERVAAARNGELLCRCPRPLDFAVQNGAGPVSSTRCSKCGRQLSGQPWPWREPDVDVTDPDVLSTWWDAQRRPRYRRNHSRPGGKKPDETPAALDHSVTARWAEQLQRAVAENGDRPLEATGDDAPHMAASHVNAPRFVAWLERQELVGKLDERDQKKLPEWRRGDRPRITIDTADRILTELGSHRSELPDDVFSE